jgi:hypothetical protein
MEWDSLLITWYSLCFWKVFLLYWEKNLCAYWGCFIFVFVMLCKFLEPNRCFFTLTVHSDVCDSFPSPIETAVLITYRQPVLSSVLNALISLLDLVSQGKCSCDAANGTLSCSFVSAFGIPLRTGSGQQYTLASQGPERSAACIFAHINFQMLYPYVAIFWLAGLAPYWHIMCVSFILGAALLQHYIFHIVLFSNSNYKEEMKMWNMWDDSTWDLPYRYSAWSAS